MGFSLIFMLAVPHSGAAADKTTSGNAAGGLAWSSTMDCAACHDKQVSSMTDSTRHASVHAKLGIDECTSCHDEKALHQAHANVKQGQNFVKARRYPDRFCLQCHEAGQKLVARTAGSKVLTDSKGRVVNPHDIPNTPKHKKLSECYMCHKEHKKAPDVMRTCTGCHHKGEFTCGTCHP